MSDFYNENPIKATRKVHYCFECQHPIPSGTACTAWAGLHSGDFNSGHMHDDCVAAVRHYRQENRIEGEEWYGLREDYFGRSDEDALRAILADWPEVIKRVLNR